jgi:hypothetical protein
MGEAIQPPLPVPMATKIPGRLGQHGTRQYVNNNWPTTKLAIQLQLLLLSTCLPGGEKTKNCLSPPTAAEAKIL